MRPWNTLDADEQLALRDDYARDTETEPGTCALDAKVARFSSWLAERGVAFSQDDLHPSTRA